MAPRAMLLLVVVAVGAAAIGAAMGFFAALGPSTNAIAGEEERRRAEEARTSPIHGFVLDEELYPIPNATVTVIETQSSFHSAADGSYAVSARPGTYLVVAAAPGHRSAAAALTVFWGERTRHDFVLEAKPVGTPYHETEMEALRIGCALAVNTIPVDCSVLSSANRQTTSFDVPASTSNAVLEIYWEAQSFLATHLSVTSDFVVDYSKIEVARVHGTTGITLWLLDWFLQKHLGPGASWETGVSLVAPFGEANGGGNKGGTGIGFAQDQTIEVYSTVFHFAPGAGTFRAANT